MYEYLRRVLDRYADKFIEIYIEEGISTRIRCRGKHIEDVSKSKNFGGQVRIVDCNRSAFISFNNVREIDNYIKSAINLAGIKSSKNNCAIEREVVTYLEECKNYDEISLKYKVDKLLNYNRKINELNGVDSSVITYGDSYKTVYYLNSMGSTIIQNKNDLIASFTAVTKNGFVNIIPSVLGSNGNFSVINDAENDVLTLMNESIKKWDYTELKNGNYPIILDPILSGVFVHEIVGHLLEGDSIPQKINNKVLEIGSKITSDFITVEDRPDIPGRRGSYKFDDQGIRANGTTIIKNGVLQSYLHSNESAAKYNVKSTGNARLVNYKYKPIVRMSNFVVNDGESCFEDMVKDIEYGIYATGWRGGNTDMINFTVFPRDAYLVQNGKITKKLNNIYLSGDISIFMNVRKVGNKSVLNQGVSCSKLDQRSLPISISSPHILLSSCFVGGTYK